MTHTIQPNNPEATPAPDSADVPVAGGAGTGAAPDAGTSPSGAIGRAASAVPAALRRRVPKYSDLAPLMQFKKPEFSRAAKLQRASTIWELRDMAKRRTPQAPFDYTDGAAEAEITLRRARQAFLDIEFRPGILRNVSTIDLGTDILGKPSRLPVGIAPTGFTRMMQSEGEYAGSQAAEAAGIPYTLSTMGTASIEDVAAAAPNGRNWFQLYLWTDRDRSLELIERAAKAGNDTLMVTVDTAVAGARLRDVRNGMTIPPALTLKTVLDASYRPAWWFNFLTHEPLTFASLSRYTGTVADLINSMFDPTLTFEDLDWLRETWKGKLVVKGIQTVDDARKVVDHGADGVVLSNHGWTTVPTAWCSPTTAAASWTGHPYPSTCCPRSPRHSRTTTPTPRSSSTRAS
jgi:L-lactate dehydrogenase (cytochrome)